MFGQQVVGIGTVGTDGEGVLGQLDSLLVDWLLEGPVHECLRLAERRVLLRAALEPDHKPMHGTFHRPPIGKGLLLSSVLVWLALLLGHRGSTSTAHCSPTPQIQTKGALSPGISSRSGGSVAEP